MLYQRVYSDGQVGVLSDRCDPAADTARIERQAALPRFDWRSTMLRDPSVSQLALAPEIAQLCHAISKEPLEQMFVWHGVSVEGVFYALHSLPLSDFATSSHVAERGVRSGHDQLSALQLELLRIATPSLACIIAHNHPFTETTKLRRLGSSESEVQALQELATAQVDLDLYPHLQSLRGERRAAAALNELFCSVLSPGDVDFTGEGVQALIWEDPSSDQCRIAGFHIDADKQARQLDEVQLSASFPAEVRAVQTRWDMIMECLSQGCGALVEAEEACDTSTEFKPRQRLAREDRASSRLAAQFSEELRHIARGEWDCERFIAEVRTNAGKS